MADPVLGKSMGRMLVELNDLILETKNAEKKKKLRAMHKQLSRKLQDLIEKTVRVNTEEYRKATAAVDESNEAITNAINDSTQAADAIKKISKAISALAKLIAILA